MNLIVAVDKNWAIGKDNRLMHHIPADMKYFREMTKGGVVVMGRKTLESFPQGQPLKNRVNIVITKNPDYKVKGAVIVSRTAADPDMREKLVNAARTALGVPSSRVCVVEGR